MTGNLCWQLLKNYDNIVAVFTDDDNNDVAIIQKTARPLWFEIGMRINAQYLITYDFLTTPCLCGDYRVTSLEEAVERVMKHRPKAYRVG